MGLLDSTTYFLKEAERVSGRPVVVQEDPTLQTLATVQIARGLAPMHVLRYRPIPNRTPDYHICYQCGFIIRLFENLPENRFSLAMSLDAPRRMDKWLLDGSASPQIRVRKDFLLNGILTQLRSIPIGLRVDDVIWEQFSDLREEQLASAKLQMAQNVQVLAPTIRKSFPKKLLRANTAMNAAYAQFWSRKTGDTTLVLPYQSVGADKDGEALLQAFSSIESNAFQDWSLVDKWADHLGLAGWYQWIQHDLEN